LDPEKPSFAAALRELAAGDRRELAEHPTPEQLTAYHAGELPAADEETLREHLALCRDCAELLLDLEDFPRLEPAAGVRPLTSEEVGEAWRQLRERLGPEAGGGSGEVAPVVPLRPRVPGTAPLRFAYALAAVFFLATVGLSVWVAQLRHGLQPEGNVAFGDLRPEGEGTRGSEPEEHYPADSRLDLLLHPLDPGNHVEFEVEIRSRESGAVLWRIAHLQTLSLSIPGGCLAPGSYRIRLLGVDGGRRVKVDDFPLRIAHSP
jgi:putative zinc finger protein